MKYTHDEFCDMLLNFGRFKASRIFIQSKLAHQLRYTLHNRCCNNEAEQLEIVKALETIGTLHFNDKIPRSATVHTDSRITLQSLQNINNHKYLIEGIRKSAIALEKNKIVHTRGHCPLPKIYSVFLCKF